MGAKTNFKNNVKGYEFQLSNKFKWIDIVCEHFYLKKKSTGEKEHISIIRGKKELWKINFILEWNRWAKDKIDNRKYEQWQLTTAVNF
ncbi:MAG: hypothetical protein QMD92_07860 [bacterium]|nr:hypothetical protein [bacterium]